MQIEYERGISNPGNLYRMKKLMARAEAGETLNIGFLGGSITQGCLASAPELCYAYRVFQWWEKTFPQAEFTLEAPVCPLNKEASCSPTPRTAVK